MKKNLVFVALKGIAIALGTAIIVISMFGIGLAAFAYKISRDFKVEDKPNLLGIYREYRYKFRPLF